MTFSADDLDESNARQIEKAISGTDSRPAARRHDEGCDLWCSHCALCGEPILYGARCNEHYGVYPDLSAPEAPNA